MALSARRLPSLLQGPGEPGSPALSGTMKALRLPIRVSTVAYWFAPAVHAIPRRSCSLKALPVERRSRPGLGLCLRRPPQSPARSRVDANGISQVFRRSFLCLCSVPGPRSSRRDLAMTATSMLPPRSGRRRPRRWLISGLTRELRHLLSYASRYRCRHVQSSLPADWLVFAGRESNPLDRYERFQLVLSIILPSCSPDATGLRFDPSGLRAALTPHSIPSACM
jgi:hypothetical protein